MAVIKPGGAPCPRQVGVTRVKVKGDEQPGEIRCTPFAESISGFTVSNV
jgi:hypothetical protein